MTIATATKSRPADFLRRLSHRYQILGLFEKIFSAFIRETVEVDAENHIHIKIEYTGKIIFHRHLIVHQRVVLLIGKLKLRIAEVEHRRSIGRVIDRTARLHLYLTRIPGIGYRIDNDEYAAIDFFIDGNLSLTPFTGVDILGNRLLQSRENLFVGSLYFVAVDLHPARKFLCRHRKGRQQTQETQQPQLFHNEAFFINTGESVFYFISPRNKLPMYR